MKSITLRFAGIVGMVGLVIMCAGASIFGMTLLLASLAIVCALAPFRPQFLHAFPSNCEGRVIQVSASTGCTLTRATIEGMTPNDFEAQGFKEIGMDRVYAQAKVARLAGYVENTLMTLLMSRITNIKGQLTKTAVQGSPSVILPFISRRQKRNINNNYWKVVSGAATPNAGVNGVHPGAWDIVIQNNPSALATTLPDIDKWFLAGWTFFVEYKGANSVAYSNAYRIVRAVTTGGVTKVTVQPNYTAAGWAALSAGEKLPFQIGGAGGGNAEAGSIGYLGVNAVSDYESYAGQGPALNNDSLIHFFLQNSRVVSEYTDEFLAALNDPLTSEYFKQFRQTSLGEAKRQQRADFDKAMLNSAFYGQRINEHQTVEGYRQLEAVVDPANPDCVLEYKAHALGFETQLGACNRVLDHQGNPLNLDTLCATMYLLKRAREADGSSVDTVDVMTDRFTAGRIQDIMIDYYTKKYGVNTTRFYQPNQKLTFENQVMLNYNVYQLPPELGGFNFAVFTHAFFDDKLSASGGSDRGRALWLLDWTDIQLGMAGTNSAVRRTNEADQLYQYVMKINVKHVTMDSMMWTPIIEDPNRHYIVRNFSVDCPTLTVSGCKIEALT